MKRTFWIISDTHFGHRNMELPDHGGRPPEFEKLIFDNLYKVVKQDVDVLIHLGDLSFGEKEPWTLRLREICFDEIWLLRGNHDNKSLSWYLHEGWSFVGDELLIEMFGKRILLSHKPIKGDYFDLNIHGHLHSSTDSHRGEMINDGKHWLFSLEEQNYKPVNLQDIADQFPNPEKKHVAV